jgi:hypothetical protein
VLACVGVIATPQQRWRATLGHLIWTPVLVLLIAILLGAAGLAYVSLVQPGVHQQALRQMDRVLEAVGLAALLPHRTWAT